MQRSIRNLVGACGLVFTFTAAGAAAGGAGGASAGGASGGAAAAGGTAGAAARATAAPAASTATAPRTSAGQSVTATPGQSVTTTPGQSGIITAPGQGTAIQTTTTGQAGQPTLPGQLPTGATLPGQATANGTIAGQSQVNGAATPTTATTTSTAGASSQVVPFNSLPAAVQSSIASQIPAGAQLGQIIQETTPQGTTSFRAQVMQNGVVSEVSLAGAAGGSTVAGVNRLGTATTAAGVNAAGTLNNATTGTGGFVVGTPYAFETLPTGVQTAFTSQSGGVMLTNITYTPSPNTPGGAFRGFADGKAYVVRVGPNGQILPGIPQVASTGDRDRDRDEVKIDEVPAAVRDAIKESMPFAEVTRIRKSESASGDLFDVTLRGEGVESSMLISENGTVVRENRELPVSIATTGTAPTLTNEPPKLALNSLPVIVAEAIQVRTQPDLIRSLVLTNYQGKTAYAVDFLDQDRLRNRIYINKEGLVVRTQTNIFGITPVGSTVVVANLPAPARATIEEQLAQSTVTRVELAMRGLAPVYVISYLENGETRQMLVSPEGLRVDAVGAPASTQVGQDTTIQEIK